MDSVQYSYISHVRYSVPMTGLFNPEQKMGTLPLQRAVLPTFDVMQDSIGINTE
jgi:hypothetical protein